MKHLIVNMHRENFTDDYEFEVRKTKDDGYSVSLPHQCDDWEIVGAEVGNTWNGNKESYNFEEMTNDYPNLPKDKKLVVIQMKLFIKRAEEALKKLEELN